MKLDLLSGKINKLYFTFLASAIGSTLMTSIYSTVDIICVGQYLGPVGSAAISCVNPFWPLMLCMGFLFGVGGSVLMSNRRGARREKDGDEFFTLSIISSLIFSVIILFVFILLKEPLLILFGAEGDVLDASLEYIGPITFTAPTFTLCATVSAFVRCDGEAALPTVGTVVGGIVNILGDIFFVFDFGLGLGAFGAGLATALGQTVAFLVIISYFFRKKCKLKLAKPHKAHLKLISIAALGFSAFIIEISFGLTSVIFNNIIMTHMSETHLAIYGTASSVLITFYCFFYATGTALQPIVSANCGARKGERVKKTLILSMITAIVIGILFFILSESFPEAILNLFMDTNETVMRIGPKILQIYTSALPITGVGIVSTYFLGAVLKGKTSVSVSLLRGLIFPSLFAFLLPLIFDYNAIFWSVPLAEALTSLISVIFIIRATSEVVRDRQIPEDI